MKTTLAAFAALTLMAGTAFGQTIPIMQVFEINATAQDAAGNLAHLQSIPSQDQFISLNPATGETSVQYSGQVLSSTIGALPTGAFFEVTTPDPGFVRPNPNPNGPPLLVDISPVSSLGGPFSLQLAGTAVLPTLNNPNGFIDFSLVPGTVGVAPQIGVSIIGHRITPEPGSLVLLGLGAAAVMGARRRKAA